MRRPSSAWFCLVLVLGSGCGQGVPAPAVPTGTTTGPHGGIAVPLGDGAGYAEILLEKEGAAKGKPKPGVRPRFAVYVLNAERTGPASPPPSEARLKVALPTGTTVDVALTASAKAGDPTGPARYVSQPGDYDYDELSGEVTVTLDGKSSTVPFALR
jgi:hypothetical protein